MWALFLESRVLGGKCYPNPGPRPVVAESLGIVSLPGIRGNSISSYVNSLVFLGETKSPGFEAGNDDIHIVCLERAVSL